MSKKQKRLVRLGVWAFVIVLALVVGYFTMFHNADVLKIKDGAVVGAKPTWLTARFAVSGGAEQYYKLADISAPKNFTAVKNAQDPDGDPLTTFFAYAGKDPEKTPGTLLFQGQAAPAPDVGALKQEGWGEVMLGETAAYVYPENMDPAATTVYCRVPSPYEGVDIEITLTLPESAELDVWLEMCKTAADKVNPAKQLSPFVADFKLNFLDDNRWQYLWSGLGVTLEITFFSLLIGVALGVLVATVRSTWDKNAERMRPGVGRFLMVVLNKISNIYLTVIRGTPAVIQLMIAYYIIFVSSRNNVLVAIISFGINSGAYVAEIIRGGIMSIDHGQFEAGRSLGLNYVQTMMYIIVPQALKNVLPSLANEFITLLKETSVSGYVAVRDLTKGGDIIRGVTYSPFLPLLAVAAVYLILVMFFTWLVGKLERRLRNSEH